MANAVVVVSIHPHYKMSSQFDVAIELIEELVTQGLVDTGALIKDPLTTMAKTLEEAPEGVGILSPFGYYVNDEEQSVSIGILPDQWYTRQMELGTEDSPKHEILTKTVADQQGKIASVFIDYISMMSDKVKAKEVAEKAKTVNTLIAM